MPQPAPFLLPTRPSRVSSWLLFVTRHSCCSVVDFPPRACFHICFCHHLMRDILFPVSYLLGYITGWGGEPHLPRTHRISIPVRLCLRLDLIRSKENCRIRKWRSPIFISRHFCLGPKSQSQMGEYFCKTNKSQVICFSPPSHLEKTHFRGKTGLPSPRTPAKMVYFFSFSFFSAY